MWSDERCGSSQLKRPVARFSGGFMDLRKVVKARVRWVANPIPLGGGKTLGKDQLCSDH